MKILILTADYESFLQWLYTRNPQLANKSYAAQLDARQATLFGVADFYSRNFSALGHTASEIFVNNIWLQSAWAREHGLSVPSPAAPGSAGSAPESSEFVMHVKRRLRPYRTALVPLAKRLGFMRTLSPVERRILLAQIEDANPDVILNQIPEVIEGDVMRAAMRRGRILIVQHGNQPSESMDLKPYDFGISLASWIVDYFRARGLPAEQVPLAFDPSVLEKLGPAPAKDIELSFVGGLSSGHTARIELLEAVARNFPIQLWLSNFKGIARNSPLRDRLRGEVWGSDMYDVLRRSKITLNSHIDAARGMACNMRLYEATGVGTFLLTDDLPNLPSLFQPGVHVGSYSSIEDCLEKIKYYLANESAREKIAADGQAHTLAHHTYRQRIETILTLVEKYSR